MLRFEQHTWMEVPGNEKNAELRFTPPIQVSKSLGYVKMIAVAPKVAEEKGGEKTKVPRNLRQIVVRVKLHRPDPQP